MDCEQPIDELVCERSYREMVETVQSQNADLLPSEIEELIEAAIRWARRTQEHE